MSGAKKAVLLANRLIKREWDYHSLGLNYLLLFLTYRCTSRCNSCQMWRREADTRNELTLEEICAFVDTLKKYRVENVELFGGDVLLRKDVAIPLVRYLKEKGFPMVEIVTNGNLLDQATAKALVDAGVDVFYFSLDGVGDLHDQVRGVPGSFERIISGMRAVKEARGKNKKPKLLVNCTVSNLNAARIEELVPLAIQEGMDAVGFEYVGEFSPDSVKASQSKDIAPEPYYTKQEKSLLLSEVEARQLKKKLDWIKKEYSEGDIRIVTKNIDCLRIENLTRGVFPNKKCYVARGHLTLDPYGNILPCPFFNSYYLGNIRSQHIDSVWGKGKHLDFIRRCAQKLPMCKHCILSVERNPTILQSLRKSRLSYFKKGLV